MRGVVKTCTQSRHGFVLPWWESPCCFCVRVSRRIRPTRTDRRRGMPAEHLPWAAACPAGRIRAGRHGIRQTRTDRRRGIRPRRAPTAAPPGRAAALAADHPPPPADLAGIRIPPPARPIPERIRNRRRACMSRRSAGSIRPIKPSTPMKGTRVPAAWSWTSGAIRR